MMKILLLGNTGQLGWELGHTLRSLGEVIALDFPAIDMADPASIHRMVHENHPQVIVNATAYTTVDKAEDEPKAAHAINGKGPGVLAEEARNLNAALIHFSTDYVFNGTKGSPYLETDTPNPLNEYGMSKWAGEQAIQAVGGVYLILRTAWVYSLRRDSFVRKVLKWARQQETLRIVDDQVSNPTWAHSLAEITAMLLARAGDKPFARLEECKGLYHLAGSGYASRYEWAEKILELDPHKNEQVIKGMLPAKSTDFPTPARRPLFSALDTGLFAETFNLQLVNWQDALKLALNP
jgi:dTDP-4-dehydrorhamnose reductase